MAQSQSHTQVKNEPAGLASGMFAYFLWGLFPIYFKLTESITATEILAHRIVWSVPFGLLILLFRHQIKDVIAALLNPKKFGMLTLAAVSLSINWWIYIWAIQQDQIFQGSLGYYINPLIYVLVGVVFFKEKLSRLQGLSVLFAAIGVLILTIYGGVFPWISLSLAVSFTIYGVIRKQVDVGAMPGLFVETLVLFLPGLFYMYWLNGQGDFQFLSTTPTLKWLLIAAGPITVIPLLAFAFAARRLQLSMLGFLQYIGPTLQFACGVYYGEKFTLAHAWCFGFIWTAVALFSWDAWRRRDEVKTSNESLSDISDHAASD